MPSSVRVIQYYAFQGLDIESITIPAAVEEIGSCAFSSCASLKEITFEPGSKLKTIGANLFEVYFRRGIPPIKHITLPDSIKSIGRQFFGGWGAGREKERYRSYFDTVSLPSTIESIADSMVYNKATNIKTRIDLHGCKVTVRAIDGDEMNSEERKTKISNMLHIANYENFTVISE